MLLVYGKESFMAFGEHDVVLNRQTIAYLGLGSNLGDRRSYLQRAITSLEAESVRIVACSPVYRSAPYGPITNQPEFYNLALKVETTLPPLALLEHCLSVEKSLGRIRLEPKGPRVIDIDVLLYGDERVSVSSLTVPHPELADRSFVIWPLLDLDPSLVDPRTQTPLARYRQALHDASPVRCLGELVALTEGDASR